MSNIIWLIFIILIISLSIKLTIKQKYITYKPNELLNSLNKDNIKPLCMFLGTKMGVGTIIGSTICIYEFGPSAIIWIIIFSLLTLPLTYQESYLGFKYRKKIEDNYISGPSYYMKNKIIKKIYIYLFLLTYTCLFLMVQTNTVSNIIDINIFVNKYVLGVLFLALLTFLLITDLSNILNILNKLVIFMCIFMLIILLIVFFKNINYTNMVINLIIRDLLKPRTFLPSLILVIKRVIFQNELLIGTTSISSSLSNNIDSSSKITIISSYFIILLTILISHMITIYLIDNPLNQTNYFELITNVFIYHFGNIGKFILVIITLILSLTTIIGSYYFGITNIKNYNKNYLFLMKGLMLLFPICGIFISSKSVWKIVDIFIFLLMILNYIEIRCLYDRQ